jgi:LAS superfamily LD-carboxypeptidase LdcB
MRLSNWSRGVYAPLARGVEQLLLVANRAGIPARVTSGRRTHAQQRALYRRFLAGMNPYPVAPPGSSDHEIGLAVDVWTGSQDANTSLGALWRSWGGSWSPRDEVHFTLR